MGDREKGRQGEWEIRREEDQEFELFSTLRKPFLQDRRR